VPSVSEEVMRDKYLLLLAKARIVASDLLEKYMFELSGVPDTRWQDAERK